MQDQITHIASGALYVLTAQAGDCIEVDAGRIWLTEDMLGEDIIIETGHNYRLRHGGRILIDADQHASIRLKPHTATQAHPAALETEQV